MKNIKFGVTSWCCPVQGIEALKVISDIGFDAIELVVGMDYETTKLKDPAYQKEYLAEAKKYGIDINSIALNGICRCGHKNKEYATAIDSICDTAIEIALAMGIEILQVPSFGEAFIRTEEDYEITIEFFKKLCDKVKDTNLLVASENALSTEGNLRLINGVAKDNFKIYFDTKNPFSAGGYNSAEIVLALKDYIVETHAKDGKDDFSSSLLGEGNSNYFETVNAFKEIGYKGAVHLENNYSHITNDGTLEEKLDALAKDLEIMKKSFL